MDVKIKTSRIGAGCYVVQTVSDSVSVTHFSTADGAAFTGWIAQANWDRNRYSDPVDTKKEAVAIAKNMLISVTDLPVADTDGGWVLR